MAMTAGESTNTEEVPPGATDNPIDFLCFPKKRPLGLPPQSAPIRGKKNTSSTDRIPGKMKIEMMEIRALMDAPLTLHGAGPTRKSNELDFPLKS
jgi:hypothetical protein